MPLTDLVRYLNSRDREQRPFLRLDEPFQATHTGATGHYARITLESRYAPIYNGRSGHLHGHAAVLNARGDINDQSLHPEAIFAIPSNNTEFVHLDRLVRTLHALNYLLHPQQQHLFVRVNLRHIENVPHGHGIVFENALRACGLEPGNITLEIGIEEEVQSGLRNALDAYRERGYRIALTAHGEHWRQVAQLLPLKPDVIRFDSRLLDTPEQLHQLALRVYDYDIRSLISVSDVQRADEASAVAIDLIQHPVPAADNVQQQPLLRKSTHPSSAIYAR